MDPRHAEDIARLRSLSPWALLISKASLPDLPPNPYVATKRNEAWRNYGHVITMPFTGRFSSAFKRPSTIGISVNGA